MNPIGYLETSVLVCGDNLDRLADIPDECIDLVYLDPPFFSNRQYEVIWGDEAEVRSFEDRWQGGMRHYIEWMRDRTRSLHRVLKPTGSLYLHCDPSASHYLKVMMDEIFGGSGYFRAEIVWKRSTAHSDTKQGRKLYGRVHDILLMYTKGEEWTWNPQYQAYDKRYVETKYKHIEPGTGRLYRLDNLTGPGGAAKGNPEYEVMGVKRYWRYSREKMDALIVEGRIIQTKPSGVPQYKRYLDEMPGVPLQDVWTDIDPINSQATERVGFPTQKPEALLDRILMASSNKSDVVLDAFCGCGTTLAVAERLGRQWVGIDISPTAINLVKRRLTSLGAYVQTYGLPQTVADLRALKPFEFQNWIIQQIHGTHAPRKTGDMGIDGFSFFEQLPVQVKQSDKVGRNVVDNFETAIRRTGKHKGYIFAFSFTRGAHEEAARAKSEGLEIALVPISDLLAPLPAPPVKPIEPGHDMIADLVEAIRRAQYEAEGSPPDRTVLELIASDTNGVGSG